MPSTYEVARRHALTLPGVEEGRSYGTPSLHVGKKLMARLREDGETMVVKVDPADRARFFEREPDTFFTTDHYKDHPVMLVHLLAIHEDALRRVIEGAWRCVVPKRLLAASGKRPDR